MRTAGAISLLLPAVLAATGQPQTPRRPVHTYCIVATDSATGEMGAAVQSHWFGGGGLVIWAKRGVGAVATQSFVEPSYRPRGLERMRAGVPAPKVLRELLRADRDSQVRQVAMIDARGRVAARTGSRNIPSLLARLPAAGPEVLFGSSPRAFGAPGAGGSFAFADPDARLGYAYVMNKMDFYLQGDPREKSLRAAVYRAVARLATRTRAVEMVTAGTSG